MAKLSDSSQLRDYGKLVGQNGTVDIHVRGPNHPDGPTKISQPLLNKINDVTSPYNLIHSIE